MLRLCSAALLLIVLAGAVRAEEAAPEARESQPTSNAILQKKVDLSVNQASLNEVLRTLAVAAEANIVIDAGSIRDTGVDVEQMSTTLLLRGVPLKDALDTILKPHGLAWQYSDEVIEITSAERGRGAMFVETYSVADLVARRQETTGDIQVDRAALDQLAEFLKASIEPKSWTESGGNGSVAVSEQTASLIVRQANEVHDQFREVLDQMRRMSDVQVVAQIKVIRVLAGDLIRKDDALLAPRRLSDTEQSAWNHGTHPWSEATVLEWANVTLQDGEEFRMRGESFMSSVTYRATVSEDRSSILVEVADNGREISTTVSIPDGKLTMIPLCKGRIPVIEDGRAFVVVIAPTIKVLEEEEELLSGGPQR
jgi:hypothetical protein